MFHDMPEFPCISGPAASMQGLACGLTEREGRFTAFPGLKNLVGEEIEILGAFTEWGEMDVESAEPEVEVFPEGLIGEEFDERFSGGREDADID